MAQFWNQKAFKNTSEWHQKYIGMVPEIGRNGTRNRSEWHQICPKLAPEMVPKLTFFCRALENLISPGPSDYIISQGPSDYIISHAYRGRILHFAYF